MTLPAEEVRLLSPGKTFRIVHTVITREAGQSYKVVATACPVGVAQNLRVSIADIKPRIGVSFTQAGREAETRRAQDHRESVE